jgi:hypothetical protein
MSIPSVTGGPNYQAFMALHPLSIAATQLVLNADYLGGNRWAQFLRIIGTTGVVESIAFSGGTPITDGGPAVTAGTNNVIAAIAQSATSVDVRTNGVSNGIAASGLTFNTQTQNVLLGAAPGPTAFINARIYGLVLRLGPNLTSTQITDTEAWLQALMDP